MSDPGSTVLAALLTNDIFLIDEISRTISEPHFVDPTLRNLYRSVLVFRSMADGVLTASAVEDLTRNLDSGAAALLQETYDALVLKGGSAADARWGAEMLRRDREKWLTQTALRDSSEILTGKITEESGREWSGPADAREWMASCLAEIESEVSAEESPAGDIRDEAREILSAYVTASTEDRSRRPLSGIPSLDAVSGGSGPGELVMVAAPSGFGKSHWCVWQTYHAAVEQGLSIYFATSETVRATVRTRLVALHSRHPKFSDIRSSLDLPTGIDSNDIARGGLDPDHHQFFALVVQDLQNIDGSMWVAQQSHGETMATLSSKAAARDRMRPIDLIVVDYIALMDSDKHFRTTREVNAYNVKRGKNLAVDFRKGNGVPVMSPWQFNRESQKEMERTGDLDVNGLAETAEAVNSADLVMGFSPDGTRDGRFANMRQSLLKNRDGNILIGGNAVPIRVDYATSYFEQRMGASNGNGGMEDPFADLLRF